MATTPPPKTGPIRPRFKNIQFMSISPLDRLLNQRGLDDEIGVEISCIGRNGHVSRTSGIPTNTYGNHNGSLPLVPGA